MRRYGSDVLLLPVVFLTDVLLFSTFLGGTTAVTNAERLIIIGYTAAGTGLLLLRRQHPVAVFGMSWLLVLVARIVLLGAHPIVGLLVALAAVAERRRPTVSLAAGGLVVVLAAIEGIESMQAQPDASLRSGTLYATFFGYLILIAIAWSLGRGLGRNSRHIRDLEDRRRIAAEQAVALERTRIARELHDIVAHAITVMVLHAAGAHRVIEIDPARAKEALATVEQTGGQAIGELRRLLGLLRESGVASADTAAPVGLARLGALVDEVRAAGVVVHTESTGQATVLDPSIDITAYRVVQESLTNVAKHSGPGTRATVTLDWQREVLDLRIADDGAGQPPEAGRALSTGHGLLGLRERLIVVGGEFSCGPVTPAGYRVHARLPAHPPVAE